MFFSNFDRGYDVGFLSFTTLIEAAHCSSIQSNCFSITLPEMENNDPVFTPKTPHFFKIVLDSTIRNKKLGIPRKFVNKYGTKLSNSVLLTVPNGDTWRVELTKSDGVLWLQNGWQEFLEFYSLKKGHLLVFKYEGTDKFLVLIFDMSTSEIKYPRKSEQVCQQLVKEEAKDNVCDEIMHQSCFTPRRKQKTSKEDKSNKGCEGLCSGEEELQTEVPGYANALLRARTFRSENPFFLVTMQPSYINPGRKLCIPKDFSLKYLKEKNGDITLSISDGRTWPARYWRYITSHKYTRTTIHIGWEPFMQENNLKAGDVCVFELISQTELKFKVIIHRQDTGGSFLLDGGNVGSSTLGSIESEHHSSKRPMTCNEKTIALQRAGNFEPKTPFFKVVVQPVYLHRNSLSVPYKFVKKYLDEEKNEAVLQVADGRTWVVKFVVSVVTGGQRKAEFYPFKTFARDNNLGRGDVCVFELTSRRENSFKVSIF